MNEKRDPRTPSQRVGHVLMKQKSRRLLDSVLRRRMVVDTIKGYGDELRYNVACRSPNYRPDELSDAMEGLKLIRQKLLNTNAQNPDGYGIFRTRRGFAPPIASRTALSPDRNANYLSTSIGFNSGSLKPPIFVLSVPSVPNTVVRPTTTPSPHTKNSARSAISNALFQSINFKKFKQEDGDPQHPGNAPTARIVPITVRKEAEKKPVKRHAHVQTPSICKSSIYLPVSSPGNHSLTGGLKSPSYKFNNAVSNGTPRSLPSVSKDMKTHTFESPDKANAQDSPSMPSSNGGPASKFRIKKISIAATPPQQSSNGDRQGRNYVTGVKIHKPSSPAKITIDLNASNHANRSAERQKTQYGGNAFNTPQKSVGDKPNKNGYADSDFIKGMIFTARREQQHRTEKSSLELQNTPRIPSYETRENNRFSYPQGDAIYKKAKTLPKSIPNHVSEDPDQEIVLPKADTKKKIIPQFYFPQGKPRPKDEVELAIKRISDVCNCFEKGMVPVEDMGRIVKACNLSLYWKGPLFHAATEGPEATEVSELAIIRTWTKITATYHDASARFVALLAKPGKNCLEFEDFLPLLKDIVDTHPGLIFLKDAPEFHTRYMNTVIARLFYVINRSWSGQITASELRKSNFLTVLSVLEEEDDINAITDYFSYEHFYVIYCKFWELDTDHDLVIDKHDLVGYGDGVLSMRLIDRVLSGAVTRWDTSDHQLGRMSYVDFVWFILSEEDKKTPTSIEYWYRCMDLDGDGYISMYEMEYFYEEQSQKLEQLDIEPLPFEDCVCQIFDIVNPKYPGKVSLNDLKKCKMSQVFFDTFFNVAKYLNNEQKDPFMAQNTVDGTLITISDWDNFAAEEYEMLVAEEQSNRLTDLSKALLDEDDEIDILDERDIDDSHQTSNGVMVQMKTGKREDEIAAELTGLNFIENPVSRLPLAHT